MLASSSVGIGLLIHLRYSQADSHSFIARQLYSNGIPLNTAILSRKRDQMKLWVRNVINMPLTVNTTPHYFLIKITFCIQICFQLKAYWTCELGIVVWILVWKPQTIPLLFVCIHPWVKYCEHNNQTLYLHCQSLSSIVFPTTKQLK